MKWPTVICCKCNKNVDSMAYHDYPATDERVFEVCCHGEREEMRLNMYRMSPEVLAAMADSVGFAFKPKLENQHGQGGAT